MPQPRQYLEKEIKGLDDIIRQMKESPDKTIAKVYALIAEDRLKQLWFDAAEIDYEAYYQKIKPYQQ